MHCKLSLLSLKTIHTKYHCCFHNSENGYVVFAPRCVKRGANFTVSDICDCFCQIQTLPTTG